ncbi:PREDICTED: B3 domain-containing protein Os01g0723500-like isoform X5 [Populus euphratica]|nr:PREDICTED: B3 domain-containing protein Os01g0723500-like isoform X5 [Populus euphratica]
MEGKTPGLVSLLGPSGDVWTAELTQENDDLLFSNGWSEFVRDHFLECGDLLVFRYHGELCFSVQVFDQSACEKEAAFHSKCSQGCSEFCESTGKKREREEEAASLEKDFVCARKKVREGSSEFHSAYIEKNREAHISACDVGGCQHNGVLTTEESLPRETNQCGNPANCFATPPQSKACSEKQEVPIWKRFGKDDDLKLHDRGHVSIFSEREKRVAESFISCFPYFVRIMKRFNVSGSYTLNIPYQFSMAHLPNCRTEIILRTIKGASWSVNSVPATRVHTSHTLCGGWMAFVRSNDINVGDVCIFELVRKYELRVFILRVGKEGPDMETGKVVSNGENTGCPAIAHTTESFPKKSRRNCLKVHSKLINKAEICDKKEFEKSQATGILRHGNVTKDSASAVLFSMSRTGDAKQQAPPIQNGKGVEAEAGLRRLVALDEERAARSFTSGFPNFVRIMRKFNVSGSYTLKIPHQFSAAYLPNCKTEVILCSLQGQCWTVNSLPDSKGRAVHTFCGGWMAFVRDNNIKIGDICMFELVGKCQMRVQISGVGHEVVNHQIGNPASNDLPLLAVPRNDPPSRGTWKSPALAGHV